MADGLMDTLGVNGASISSSVAGVGDAIYWLLIMLVLGIITWTFMHWISFKTETIIREVVNGRKLIRSTRGKIVKKKDGLVFFQLRQLMPFGKHIELNAPPEDAIDITFKGKQWVEVYKTSTGEYFFIKDAVKFEEVPKEIYQIFEDEIPDYIMNISDEKEKERKKREWALKETQKRKDEWLKKNNVVTSYEPITTAQRQFFIQQIRTAHEKNPKSVMQFIGEIAPFMALVIIIALHLIFWGKYVEPFQDMAQKMIVLEKEKTEQLKIMQEIKQDIQTIKTEKGIEVKKPPE